MVKYTKGDILAQDRTHLANERTLLAYLRTALAFFMLGAVVAKLMSSNYAFTLAIISIVGGILLLAYGTLNYFKNKEKINYR